jgi:hydroxymethylpyrimidine pyrophosphatase-like HAD family hydrolase
VNLATGELRAACAIPAEAAAELFRRAVEEGLGPMAYLIAGGSTTILHGGASNLATRRYLDSLSSLHPVVRDHDWTATGGCLSMILLDDPDRLQAFLGSRCGSLGLTCSIGKSAYTPGLGVGEVQAAEANKAAAALALLRELGLETSALCAFGDNMNDLPLLLAAGEAYCPPDAVEDVLEAVSGRIAPAAEEGVAGFLEALIEALIE